LGVRRSPQAGSCSNSGESWALPDSKTTNEYPSPETTSHPGWCGSASLTGRSGFPILTELVAALEHVRLGILQVAKDPSALNYIAGAASRNEILSMLHPLMRPRVYKIHGHNEGILKTRRTIEPAILAAIQVPFQDAATFFRC
jgi:hypothetical protein